MVEVDLIDFHLMFVPMSRYRHPISGNRGRIDTVSKQYYQFLLHRAVRYYGDADLHIRPDLGECSHRLPDFVTALNAESNRRFGHVDPVRTISPSCSATSPARHFLQFLDVSIGALAAIRNGRFDNNEGSFKAELAREIWEFWGAPDLSCNTAIADRRFNIWNVVPSWQT